MKNVQIIYDTHTRDFQARLVVEVDVPDKPTVGVDIGENWLRQISVMALGIDLWTPAQGHTPILAEGQSKGQTAQRPSQMSRRYRQIAQPDKSHALHIASRHVCADKGVGLITGRPHPTAHRLSQG